MGAQGQAKWCELGVSWCRAAHRVRVWLGGAGRGSESPDGGRFGVLCGDQQSFLGETAIWYIMQCRHARTIGAKG